MIEKIHYQCDSDNMLEAAGGQLSFLIEDGVKMASDSAFSAEDMARHAPGKNQFLQHVIAMGDYEMYGPNRNWDAWSKAANQGRHQTFVSHGHFFREHRNRDAKTQGIGTIPASAYNEKMARIELLVLGDKDKAEEEYQMAKEGKALSYSMSARLKADECSICTKRAATRFQYCDHLKHGMGKYHPEFEKYAFAFNPDPTYFDISRVKNPADRIAHYISYRFPDMQKAASADLTISGADWAEFEGVNLPDSNATGPAVTGLQKLKILEKLASMEEWFELSRPVAQDHQAKFASLLLDAWDHRMDKSHIDSIREKELSGTFRKLAKRQAILPFDAFMSICTGKDFEELSNDDLFKQACASVPNIFRVMFNNPDSQPMEHLCEAGSELQSAYYGDPSDKLIDNIMGSLSPELSIDSEPVRRRLMISVTKSAGQKKTVEVSPVITPEADAWALMYGHYKVAALNDIANIHGAGKINDTEFMLAVSQNFIYGKHR